MTHYTSLNTASYSDGWGAFEHREFGQTIIEEYLTTNSNAMGGVSTSSASDVREKSSVGNFSDYYFEFRSYHDDKNSFAGRYVELYSPPTVASTVGGVPVTITKNKTVIDNENETNSGGSTSITYDTQRSTTHAGAGGTTVGTANTGNIDAGVTVITMTGRGASTRLSSRDTPIDYSTVTTNATQGGGWNFQAYTTDSYTYETSGPSGTGVASSWYIATTNVNHATSQTVSVDTGLVKYYEESFKTVYTIAGTAGPIADPNYITTSRARSPFEDTVIIQNAGRSTDVWLGSVVWIYTDLALGVSASKRGRFTDFYSSYDDQMKTISAYQLFTSSAITATAITVAKDTVATVSEVWNTAGGGHWNSVPATIEGTSKNGIKWDSYETQKSGSVILSKVAESNYSSGTNTVAKGDIYSSVETITGTGPGYPIYETHIYHQVQETGYESGIWTSTMTTDFFPGGWSETEFSRLALYSSNAKTEEFLSRSTLTAETMIQSYHQPTGSYLGLVPRTTTHVVYVPFTSTVSEYNSQYNPEVENYSTQSFYQTGNYQSSEGYTKSETRSHVNYTKNQVFPNVQYYPYNLFNNPFPYYGNIVQQRVPANGYAGFGRNFETEDLSIFLSVQAGRVSGTQFASQNFLTDYLPTAKAYDNVTFFPVRTDYEGVFPYGMQSSRYINRSGSIGQNASVAVTWSSLTEHPQSGTGTSYRYATYTVNAVTPAVGEFYSQNTMITNSSNPRDYNQDAPIKMVGGFGGGRNDFTSNYTVYLDMPYAEWTEYSIDSSVGSFSTSASRGSVSFTVNADKQIVFHAEQYPTFFWGGNNEHHYISSVKIFPT